MIVFINAFKSITRSKGRNITRGAFVGHGAGLEFHPGADTWFDRINAYCAGIGVQAEHYIISSGLREIIEGSAVYRHFREVFACEFLYDADNIAVWPKNVVNYTTKTQFVYRINKGVLNVSDDDALNKYTPENERHIPFRNMIYIGDGLTDVPCMRLVKTNGGYSIAVYTDKSKALELLSHGRVNLIAPANYSEGGELDGFIKDILLKMSKEDGLAAVSMAQIDEF